MAIQEDQFLKEAKEAFVKDASEYVVEMKAVRGGRPSVELIEDVEVNAYEQKMKLKQLASLSVVPPREIRVEVWDKGVLAAVAKAIDQAGVGLSTAIDGNVIHANLSQLGTERREELAKLVKKTAENYHIRVRTRRDEFMKKLKAAEDAGELPEDRAFALKDKLQKVVEEANVSIEKAMENKIDELSV